MAYKASSDRALFLTTSLLAIFGLVILFSASSITAADEQFGKSPYSFLLQLVWAVLGYSMMIALMNIDYHYWQRQKLVKILLVLSAASLLLVFVSPEINNAHRWIRYHRASFQPSEMAKLVILIFVAGYLHKHESEINLLKERLVPCLAVVLSFAAVIAIEPDLGQSVCLCLIVFVLLFMAGLKWKYIGIAAAAGAPLGIAAVIWKFGYQLDRILVFLNPSLDPLGKGWQIAQSLTAVGSGGAIGLGLGAGKQKLWFLPEAPSDFIFAIVGEELGLIGTSLICLAFLFFFYRGIKIALKAPDSFGFYLAMGITIMVAMQAFLNISMVLSLMPTKGIALPFISQGGSSLLLNLTAAGILLNISNYTEKA
jgi:cell division protein FtsW